MVLFIDEIHLVLGAGKAEGAMDAANLLKPMLARGELRCIGATTLAEYRQHIEKDAAFERRFQQVGWQGFGLWAWAGGLGQGWQLAAGLLSTLPLDGWRCCTLARLPQCTHWGERRR